MDAKDAQIERLEAELRDLKSLHWMIGFWIIMFSVIYVGIKLISLLLS